MIDSTVVSPGIKTPKCGVGFVPIFERYLVATGYRPHSVDTAKALRDNEFAPSPECAENPSAFLRGHCPAAPWLGSLAQRQCEARCIAFTIGLLRRRPIFWLGTAAPSMWQRPPDP
jgi:hypothetical protein